MGMLKAQKQEEIAMTQRLRDNLRHERAEYEKQIQDLHSQLHDAVKEAVQIPEYPETATIATNTSFSADALLDTKSLDSTITAPGPESARTTTTTRPNPRLPRVAADSKTSKCNSCSIM